jgi:hypothetical protein
MPKLTLSVDRAVVERAKRYAKSRGTSVSRLVEMMLDMAAAERPTRGGNGGTAPGARLPPVLARLRGSLRRGSRRDYERYLERKYR